MVWPGVAREAAEIASGAPVFVLVEYAGRFGVDMSTGLTKSLAAAVPCALHGAATVAALGLGTTYRTWICTVRTVPRYGILDTKAMARSFSLTS